MADEPKAPGNGEEQPVESIEANDMVEAFGRIRDGEKRRILIELVRAIADDQSGSDGGG